MFLNKHRGLSLCSSIGTNPNLDASRDRRQLPIRLARAIEDRLVAYWRLLRGSRYSPFYFYEHVDNASGRLFWQYHQLRYLLDSGQAMLLCVFGRQLLAYPTTFIDARRDGIVIA